MLVAALLTGVLLSALSTRAQTLDYRSRATPIAGSIQQVRLPDGYRLELLTSRLLPGSFHGMPWFQYDGERLKRDSCIRRPPPRPLAEVVAPVATLPARNVPMGVAFVTKGTLDPRLEGDAIVALRGSWGPRPTGSARGAPPAGVRPSWSGCDSRLASRWA